MDILAETITFAQIVMIDVTLAGDNAVTVGMAVAGLPESRRRKAIVVGIGAATVLRILFAVFAVQLLHITGLLVAGGLLLLWVAWKMLRDIRSRQQSEHSVASVRATKSLSDAVIQIVIADVSMSLDNVLAIAGVARDHLVALVVGLVLSVVLMGVASTFIARLTDRHPWTAYAGFLIVLIASSKMIWDGATELAGLLL